MVAGFAFNRQRDMVLLIQKNKPAWMRGLLNGVGGKLELDETPDEAMVREFHEETGIKVLSDEFKEFCLLVGSDWCVHFYRAFLFDLTFKITTDEVPQVVFVEDLAKLSVLPNLRWLIPMALDKSISQLVTVPCGTKFEDPYESVRYRQYEPRPPRS
jgi:8-oxo-dGTP diphosphatase